VHLAPRWTRCGLRRLRHRGKSVLTQGGPFRAGDCIGQPVGRRPDAYRLRHVPDDEQRVRSKRRALARRNSMRVALLTLAVELGGRGCHPNKAAFNEPVELLHTTAGEPVGCQWDSSRGRSAIRNTTQRQHMLPPCGEWTVGVPAVQRTRGGFGSRRPTTEPNRPARW